MKARKSNSSWRLISTVAAVLWCVAVGRAGATDLPSSVSADLQLHLMSDVGVTIDTSTHEVTEWADQSGKGNHASTSGNEPDYVPNVVMGKPAIRFTGANNDHIDLPTPSALGTQSTDYELFIVTKYTLSQTGFPIAGGYEQYEIHTLTTTGARFIPKGYSSGAGASDLSGVAFGNGEPHILAARVDADNSHYGVVRIDGTDSTDWTTSDARSSDNTALRLGQRNNASLDFTGDIFEVLIYNKTLSVLEREQVEAYLAERWQASAPSLPVSASGNLSLYLKSDVGIAENVNGVAQWLDQSGNGNHASTSGNEPDYVPNVVLGKPAIQFTAANSDHIDLPTPSALGIQSADYELFIVAKYSLSQVTLLIAGGYEMYEILAVNATSANFIPNGYSGGAGGSILAAGFGDGSTHIVSGRVDANNSHYGLVRVDGTDSTDWTTFDARSSDNTALRLGVRTSGVPRYFTGDMFEVLIYNRTLTDVERVAVESYLKERWMASSDYTWDSSGGSLPLEDGAGTWGVTTGGNNWYNGSAWGEWGNTALDKAIIGVESEAADTITVSGTVTLNDLQFDPPGSGNYTLSSGTLSLAGVSPTMTLNTDAEIASTIAGTASLTKTGTGTLTLSGNNTYSGVTTVSAGVLQLGHINALGATSAGTVVESGAALDLNAFGSLVTGIAEPLTISGSGTGTGSGALYNSSLLVGQPGWGAINGVVTLAGNTTIGGVARIDNGGEITDNGNGYTLTKTGTFAFVRTGAANFSHLVIDEGGFTVTGNNALPGSSGTVAVNAGTSLQLYGSRTVSNDPNITFSNSTYSAIFSSGGNIASITGTMTLYGAVSFRSLRTVHTIYSDIDGSGDLTLTSLADADDQEFIFAGNNIYTGSTTVGNGASGSGKIVLVAGSANAFGNNSAFDVTANSTLALDGNDNAIGSLTGNGTVENANATAATLSTGGDNTDTIFAGTIQDGVGSALALTKTGDGTLTLSGDNTYSGLTTVSAGVLQLGHINALGDTSAGTVVESGAALDLNGIDGWNVGTAEPITISGAGVEPDSGALYNGDPGSGPADQGAWAAIKGDVTLAGDATVGGVGRIDNFYPIYDDPADTHTLTMIGTGNWWQRDAVHFRNLVVEANSNYGVAHNEALPSSGTVTIRNNATLSVFAKDVDISNVAIIFEDGSRLANNYSQAATQTVSGTITLEGEVDFNGNRSDITSQIDASIGGTGSLVKNNAHTLVLANTANDYAGGTTINLGTLRLGASNVLPDGGAVTLAGGTLDTDGNADSVGTLTVTAGSTIALGDGSARLAFDDSSGETWTADVQLTGELGTSAPTALRFGTNGSGLEQNQIDRFVLGGTWNVRLDGNGYLVAFNHGALFLFR